MADTTDDRPHSEAAATEVDERVHLAVQLMTQGWSDWEVKRLFAERYGIKPTTAKRYLAVARGRLREASMMETADLLAESRSYYQSVIKSPSASVKEKLDARKNLDHLLGLPWLSQKRALTPEAPSPDEAWAALKEDCRTNVARFAYTFFPHLTPDPFSPMQHDFFETYRQDLRQGRRGIRDATAAPRGHSKTTIKSVIKLIHDCVYALEDFVVVISSNSTLADDKVKLVRDEIASNRLLNLVYGQQQGPHWNMADFTTTGGTRVLAASPRTQVRGLLSKGRRPSKILLDDAENSEHVQTQLQREKLHNWLVSDILKLGDRDTNVEAVGTILHPESLLAKLLKNPGWRARTYRAVESFATDVVLWQEWRARYIDLDNPHRREDALSFYHQHQRAMDAGAAVLWPTHESYYELMVMRLTEGDAAFFYEKQNEPLATGLFIFDLPAAAYCTVGPETVVRRDGRRVALLELGEELVAYWDPALGQSGREGDFSCCVIVGRDRQGYTYVLDCYLAQEDPPDQQVQAVVELLWRWQPGRLGIEANGFQSLLVNDVREALAARSVAEHQTLPLELVPVTNLRAKHIRIGVLQPQIANHWLIFSDRLPAAYFEQFATFRMLPDAGKDDGPDATEAATRLLKGIA